MCRFPNPKIEPATSKHATPGHGALVYQRRLKKCAVTSNATATASSPMPWSQFNKRELAGTIWRRIRADAGKAGRDACAEGIRPRYQTRRITSEPFVPPKPKEFFSATRIGIWRASWGQ